MDRETKELVIQGRKFVVKTFATPREAQAIEQALFRGSKVEMIGDQAKVAEFNTAAAFEQQQELVSQMVLSMDGTTEGIVDRCLDTIPSDCFNELVVALDEIVSKKNS